MGEPVLRGRGDIETPNTVMRHTAVRRITRIILRDFGNKALGSCQIVQNTG
jgi:hypothetical protein